LDNIETLSQQTESAAAKGAVSDGASELGEGAPVDPFGHLVQEDDLDDTGSAGV
jgi:hypothetical protein